MRHLLLITTAALAACSPAADAPDNAATNVALADTAPTSVPTPVPSMPRPADAAPGDGATPTPLAPPAPGELGGLDDDRAPLDERPQPEASAQGAGQVVQSYYALIEAGRYAQAYALWEPGRAGMTRQQFVRSFDRYAEYHANIGKPGAVEGAAGSRYVTVPVQPYGRLREGARPFNMRGSITLRRVAEVPGATAAQRRWRIYGSEIKPRPGEAQPSPGATPVAVEDNRSIARYRCEGGVRLTARFDPDNGVVTVLRDGQRLATLSQQRAASGIWYRGRGYALRGKGSAMTWTAPGAAPLSCTAIQP